VAHCETVLRKAAGLHVDECEAIHVRRRIITARITDSEIAELKQNFEDMLGIRLIQEKKILSAVSTDPDDLGIVERALQCRTILQPREFWRSLPSAKISPKVEKTYDKKLGSISSEGVADLARAMIDSASHHRISRISGSLNLVTEDFEIKNSSGLERSDRATYISGTINTESEFGTNPVSGFGTMACRTSDSFSPSRIGRDAKEMCLDSINPERCEPGTYSVIFEPYAMGEMLAFVFSSNFSLKTYSERRSCFSDRLGMKIAADDFSLVDDPHYPDGVGSKSFDDEGVPTSKLNLIDSGIFSSTYSDSFHAFREGQEPTGNASRMGNPMGRTADPIPVPAPHNLVIKNGQASLEEMVGETKRGLLVGRLWYTYSVNPERGDFSCTARSGIRMIENGKITSPGRPVRIVHNLPLLLQNIDCVGKDSRNILPWSALPSITPSVKVNGIRALPI